MKIILDEDAPYPLRPHLSRHEVETVARMGWGGITNGDLLGLLLYRLGNCLQGGFVTEPRPSGSGIQRLSSGFPQYG